MTRECSEDFERIKLYIGNYSISGNIEIDDYVNSLKLMHKRYFSLISWVVELKDRRQCFINENQNCNDEIVCRFFEASSDFGSSLFNWVNGNYKTSKIMVRSAIENFVRAVSALDDKKQLTEKSVFQMFDVAKRQCLLNGSFSSEVKNCFDILHNDYKSLCADVHTATTLNMENLSSLADFPAFHQQKSHEASGIFQRVLTCITAIFCIIFNKFYHSMHHRNRENILSGVDRKCKRAIVAPND